MTASPTLKGAFALLLALSVGGKFLIPNRAADQWPSAVGPTEWTHTEADAVAAFLGRHGFRVGEVRGTAEPPSLRAAAGDCELLANLVTPEGFQRGLVRQLASERDQVSFVFDGATYADQPAWLTWTHHQWRVLNGHLGRRTPARPVLGIVASPACDLRSLPWGEIAELPWQE